jgi:hypothetical protein
MEKKKEKMVSKKLSRKPSSKSLTVSKDEFLRLRPIISPFVQLKKETEKDLLVILDLRELKKKKLIKRFFPTPNTKKILLDKLGKDVFHLCDGYNRVKDITKKFKEKYKLTETETELSVQKYLMNLTERNLIGFLIPKEIAEKNQIEGNAIEKVILE